MKLKYLLLLQAFLFGFLTNAQTSNNALNFDGIDDHVVVSPTIPYSSTFTLEAWVNYSGSSAKIFGWGNNTINGYVDFSILNGRIRLGLGNGATFTIDQFDGSTALSPNTWYHVAVVKNGVSITMYLNGVQDGAFTSTNTPALVTSSIIGAGLFNGIVQGFDSKSIDELRVWNVARSQSEIASNLNCNINPQVGLAAHYRFNQGIPGGTNTGTVLLTDISGNSQTGVLNNFSLVGLTSNWVNSTVIPATGNYRSVSSGGFNSLSTWEVQVGDCWEPATEFPSVTSNNIVIRAGHTVTINSGVNADQIIIDPSGTLEVNSAGSLILSDGPASDLVVNGTLNLNNNGILTGNGIVLVNSSGIFNWGAGTISGSISTNISSSATLNITGIGGSATLNNSATIVNSGGTINWTGAGNINCNAAGSNVSITNGGSFLMNATADINNTSGGIFFITNSSSGSILRNVVGNTTITANVGFVNQGSITNSLSTSTITIQSTDFNLANGSSLANDGTINFTAGSDADITGFTDISGNGNININGGLVRVANSTNVSGLQTITLLNAGIIDGPGTLQFNSGTTLNWTSGILRGSGTTRILTGAILNINGGGNSSILQDNRIIDNNGTINWSTNGNIIYNLASTNATINNSGNFNITASAGFSNQSSGAQLTLNNNVGGTIIKTNGNTTLDANVNFINSGTTNVNSGTLTLNNTSGSHAGTYFVANGAAISGSHNINFTGATFTNFGNITNNALTFSGTTASQALNGIGSISYLTINNIFGVDLGGNQTINSLLIFNNGNLNTGSNKVIVATTASLQNFSATDWYVNGNLQLNYVAGSNTQLFRVGDGLNYRPVLVTVFNSLGNGGVTVSTFNGDNPNIAGSGLNPLKSVNRYWSVEVAVGNTDVQTTFNWQPSDLDPDVNVSTLLAREFNGSNWSIGTVTLQTASSARVRTVSNGVNFYQIGEGACSPTNQYRSFQSGQWSNPATWETFDGCNWVPSAVSPNQNSSEITIRSPHTVTLGSFNNVSIDQTVIENGATLNVTSSSILNISNGPGIDLLVNGSLLLEQATLNIETNNINATQVNFDNSGILNWGNGGTINVANPFTSEVSFQGNSVLNMLGNLQRFISGSGNLALSLNPNSALNFNDAAELNISDLDGIGTVNFFSEGSTNFNESYFLTSAAQFQFINTGTVQIPPGVTVDFENRSTFYNFNSGITNISGTLNLNQTFAEPDAFINQFGTFNIETGGQLFSLTRIEFKGPSMNNNGIVGFNFGFNGDAPQTLGGTGKILGLRMDNANGLTLNSNHRIEGNFALLNGLINTGNSRIILEPNTSVAASPNSWVNGNLEVESNPGAGGGFFEVGDQNFKAPFYIGFDCLTGGSVLVNTTGSNHPNISNSGIDINKSIDRFWSVQALNGLTFSNGSITVNPTSDIDPSANFSNFIAARFDGTNWSLPTIQNNGSFVSITDLSAFGDFVVGEASTSVSGLPFRTISSGDWFNASIWEYFDGINWVSSPVAPDQSSGQISIETGHNVEVNFNTLNIDDLTIQFGGTLTTSFATLQYETSESRPFIQVNGTLNLANTVINGFDSPTGVLNITGDGQMNVNFVDANNLQIVNNGTINCGGSEIFRFSNSTLNNLGIMNVGSNLSLFGNSSLTNNNLIIVNANIEISSVAGGFIDNTNDGDIRIEANPTISADIQNSGEIIVVSGSQLIHNAPAFALGGSIIVESGAQISSSNSIQMNATSVLNDGGINANPLFFTGLATNLSGTGSLRSVQLINNAQITLGSNHTISETLDFAGGGRIITGANTLTLAENASIIGNSNLGYVQGNLQRFIAASGPVLFPVGDANRAAPITITPSVDSPGLITVSTTGSEHPEFGTLGLDPNSSLNRFWSISNQSLVFSVASIDFGWGNEDVDAGANEFAFVSARYNGLAWSFPTTTNAQSGQLNATNILEFGDFAIAQSANVSQGASLNFDGVNDEVEWGGNLVPNNNRPYALSVWVKSNGSANNRTILSQGNNLWLAVNNFGDIQIADNWVTGAQFPNDNNWHNLIIVRNEQTASLYLDGAFVSENDFPLGNPDGNFVLGSSPNNDQFWSGSIDELRIWNKPLCSSEVENFFGCSQVNGYSGLQSNFNFNQGTADGNNTSETTLIDNSGGNLNGTLLNFDLTGSSSNFTADAFPTTGACPGVETIRYYRDADGDGFGNSNNTIWLINVCGFFPGYVLINGDCNDNDPTISPANAEVCNGTDDNCDGQIDNNNSLNFDGVNDFVQIFEPAIGAGEFTIEFWMRPESYPFDQMYLVTNRTTESDNAGNWYRISMLQGGFIQAEFGLENQPSGLFLGSTSQLELNSWSHVALTRSNDNTVRIYINGVLENTANDFPRNFASLDGNAYIGQWQGLGIAAFDGSIDDLRFWGVERTQNEIRSNLVSNITSDQDLLRNYTFNQGGANGENGDIVFLRDLSQGIDGELVNFDLSSDVSGSNWSNGFLSLVYADSDNDGFGDPNNSQEISSACAIPVGFVSDFSDCDDQNGNINPNGAEIQNGVDDNCNGQTDEGFSNCNISLTSTTGNQVIICTESGATTANVQLVVNNGLPPYSFGAQDSLNLTVGIYTFTVTDEAGCQASANIELVQANCIVPYYQPPANDTISNLIGAELTQLFFFPETFADTTVADNIFEIKQLQGEVLIEVIANVGQYDALLTLLQTAEYGINNLIDNGDSTLIITGFYPIANLKKLDSLPDLINYVRPYYAPIASSFANTGLTVTQGDKAMGADNAKNGWNMSGNGVKVGVLSDSYNTKAGDPAQLDVENGDLPGAINPNFPNPVNVLFDYPFGRASDEGRAMLQIIHDVAPNAELYFRSGFVSAGNMAEGIKELQAAGCDVIVDDITYITEPYFLDGVVAQAVEEVSAAGVNYVTSAGNFGVKSYEGVFTPTTAPNGYAGVAHDFGGGDVFQSISLEPGTFTIALQWEDGFYSLGQTTGTLNDLDIYLVDQFGNRLFGFNRNNLDGDPLEILPFVVRADVNANLIITRKGGNEAVRFKYIIFRGDATINEFNQGSSTIMGQANAESAMTIGAVLYTNTPAFGVEQPTVASFSSRGGLEINGLDRQKPDFCGPNGVNTTVNLGGVNLEDDLFPNFFGTSAAAPHVAAAAALILEAKQTFQGEVLNGAQMKALITENLTDMGGDDDYDAATGNGYIEVDKVLSSFSNPQPTAESLEIVDPTAVVGEEPIEVIVKGQFFDENASIVFQYENLDAQFMNDSTLIVQIPPFVGNPPLTVVNPALTNSGLDGGVSDSLYFFGTIPQNVVVQVNNAVKRFGEQIPAYEVEVSVNGTPLASTGLSMNDLGLSDLTFTSSANAFSNVGLYFRRANSSVTDLSLPESQALAEFYNYQFIDGVLTIERMPITVTPKDTTLEYGDAIDGRAIQFDYTYLTESIAAEDQVAFLDSIKQTHQSTMSQTVIVVDGKAVVEGRTLTEADLTNLSFFASGNVEANTISSGRGKRIVNGVEFDTLRYVSLAPEAIFSLQEDDVNLNLFNALSAGRGKRIVNTLAAGRGKRIVNGESLINGTPIINGISSGRGKRIVNSNTFNDISNEFAILLLDSLDAVISENNDSVAGYTSMNLITGVEVGEWLIAPGVLISDNFDISYSLGKITITPMELFIRAENKTKTCTDSTIEFTSIKEFYQYENVDSTVVSSGPEFTILNQLGEPVSINGLSPGTYQIIPSNLVQLDSIPNYIPVYEPGQLIVESGVTAQASAGTITCFGGTTSVVVSATGGTEPYSGIGTFTVSAGEYNFTVTDAIGCVSTVSGTISQPAALPPQPTDLSCWQTATFNDATCSWDVTGTQPAQPTNLACWQNASFDTLNCGWVITGTQPVQPTNLACWQNASFDVISCGWVISGTQPVQPTNLACWQNATFDAVSCGWIISGTQPVQPTNLACWQNAAFDTESCGWVISGTQPVQPTNLACWQNASFDTESCGWIITGTQPVQPTNLACWQNSAFDTESCGWIISGTEPVEPAVIADAIPQISSEPFAGSPVVESRARWGATGFEAVLFTPANPGPPPAGVGLNLNPVGTPVWLDGFTRNFQFTYNAETGASTWAIDWNNNQTFNNGESVTSTATSLSDKGFENVNIFLQGGAVEAPNTGASVTIQDFTLNGVNFGNYSANNNTVVSQNFKQSEGIFGNITATGRINFTNGSGTLQERPRFYLQLGRSIELENQNCWDSLVLNNSTCEWENIGVQPTQPSGLACWQNATFNTESCSWDVTGTQPPQPTGLACWQNATFNTVTCAWEVRGSQPEQPTLACYENAVFNNSTCSWVVSGSPAPAIITNGSACGSYTWAINNQQYTASGTYNFSANCQEYVLNLVVTPQVNDTTEVAACDSYTWNGIVYTQSGIYTLNGSCENECAEVQVSPYNCNGTGFTSTISNNNADVNVGPGQTVRISAGSFTRNLNITGGTLVICGSAVPQNINMNTNGNPFTLVINGSVVLNNLNLSSTATIENYGSLTLNNSVGFSGTIKNYGTLSCQADFNVNSGGKFYNYATASLLNHNNNNISENRGTLQIGNRMQNNGNASLLNTCTMNVGNQMINNSFVRNEGSLTIQQSLTINGGGLLENAAGKTIQANSLMLNGTIRGTGAGLSRVSVNTSTVINGGGKLEGTTSLCDANGVETNNGQIVAPAFIGCNGNVSSASCCATSTLVLTIQPSSTVTTPITSCGNYTWAANGQTYNQSGTYSFQDGCVNRILQLTVITAPTVSVISGPTNSCPHQGSNGVSATYSVEASNASTYQWTLPSGSTNITGQGTATISFRFSSSFNSGTVSVNVSGCGSTVQRSISVSKSAPTTPIAISGPTNLCAFRGTNTQVAYSIAAVANASSYTWTIPSGITLVSGAGTTSIQVLVGANFTSGTLKVRANSACGNSSTRNLSLNTSTPSTPGSIAGSTKACSGDAIVYTVNPVNNATSYLWTIPTGTSITAGAGTNSITLSFGSAYNGGTLSVRATNGCGQSNARSLTLGRNTPSTPVAISGPTNNLCGGGNFIYSIAPVANATSYTWTVPSGCNIVTNNGTSVTVSFPSNFNTGSISVRAVNGCGSGTARNLSLNRLPSTPTSISGPTTVCINQQNVVYTTPAIAGLTYNWTVPSGATITSGQGTSSITVKFGNCSGNVSVRASNICGNSSTRSLSVCVAACRLGQETPDEIEAIVETAPEFVVFPNPGNGQFTLRGINSEQQSLVQIYSSSGQLVRSEVVVPGVESLLFNLEGEAKGLYLIRIENAEGVHELRYVKQ